jgi:tetratricopeptide (TPR) repeat protein
MKTSGTVLVLSALIAVGIAVSFFGTEKPNLMALSGDSSQPGQASPYERTGFRDPSVKRRELNEEERAYLNAFTEQTGRALTIERQGDAAAIQGRYDEAERYYRQAISTSPKFEGSNTVVSEAPRKLALMFLYRRMWQEAVDTIIGQGKHGEISQVHPVACIAYVELGDIDRARTCAPSRIGSFTFDQYPEELPPPPSKPAEWKAASYYHIAVDIRGYDEPFKLYADHFFAEAADAYPEVVPYSFEYAVFLWSRKLLLEARDRFQTARRNTKGPLGERIDNILVTQLEYPIAKKWYKTR